MLGGIGLSQALFLCRLVESQRFNVWACFAGLHAYAQHSGNGFLTSKWFSPPAGASTIVAHIEPLMRLSAPAALNAALDVVHP
jgi:hypothetical protein